MVDYGGVLTTDIWTALRGLLRGRGAAALGRPRSLPRRSRRRSDCCAASRPARSDTDEFEPRFGALLGLSDHDGLTERLFAGLEPDEAMIGAVRAARARGQRTGLISNSWGLGIYERAPTGLFDEAVISGEVGLHKPQPEIYLLSCERLGVQPGEAVFVDDLRENCAGAEAVGMTAHPPPLERGDGGRDRPPARLGG